jgi:Leucine-rich repeat (LRR) protein
MKGSHILVGNIKVLLLANNCIKDVQGLDRLYSLKKLDLSNNRISKLCDVSALAKLPELMELNLKGNPFASKGKNIHSFLRKGIATRSVLSFLLTKSHFVHVLSKRRQASV